MTLKFEEITNLPTLNIGDIKNNVVTCKIYVVSHSDRYVYATEIEYNDNRKEKYKIGYIGGMIAYDVINKEGMTTSMWTYPIDPFISKDEIIVNVSIIPYNNIKTGNIEPATLELQIQKIRQGKFVIEEFPLLSFK